MSSVNTKTPPDQELPSLNVLPTSTTKTSSPVKETSDLISLLPPTPNHANKASLPPAVSYFSELAGGRCMTVVDPLSRKLQIPCEAIAETRAQQRLGIPSLCMLFQLGRCRQGINCHQVHADPNVVNVLRSRALEVRTCCGEHGDQLANEIPENFRCYQLHIAGFPSLLPLHKLAVTVGLKRLLQESCSEVVTVPPSMVCRLHGLDRCRFAEDCKFLHICKELLQQCDEGIMAAAHAAYTPSNGASFGGQQMAPPYFCLPEPMYPPSPYSVASQPSPAKLRAALAPSDSLNGMTDANATPPATPTFTPGNSTASANTGRVQRPSTGSPVHVSHDGSSWSYEPYSWAALPPSVMAE